MHIKYLTCILITLIETIYSGLPKASPFYLYDRFNNRAVSYMFADTGNIYYMSKNFHSEEFAKIPNITKGATEDIANTVVSSCMCAFVKVSGSIQYSNIQWQTHICIWALICITASRYVCYST
jgi:hypothetical protein